MKSSGTSLRNYYRPLRSTPPRKRRGPRRCRGRQFAVESLWRVVLNQLIRSTRTLVLGFAALLGLSGVPLSAHHAFSAEFDAQKPVTLRGTLTKMEWVNPHGWIYLDVKGTDGKIVNWAIETGSTNSLIRRGLRRTDFPYGVEVIVEGYRARNGTPPANGAKGNFADGRKVEVGAPGTGAPEAR
jgi:hypothetical protein